MEYKKIEALPLKVFTDEIFKISYLSCLTRDNYLKIKLPCNVKNYKYQHLLKPNFIITCELIKTRKNWILKDILGFIEICQLKSFEDYLKYSQICNHLEENIRENQPLDTLDFLEKFWQKNSIQNISLSEFESSLKINLGFC
jgi:hypothetical protein